MQAIDFFSGDGSFAKIARGLGIQVFTLDYNPKFNCDITMDILDFDPEVFPEISPDIIWASPDCTSFSFASGGFHRGKFGEAKTAKAILGNRILEKTLRLIEQYVSINPDIIWYIENPRGHMAKSDLMLDFLDRTGGVAHLITYCSYGGPFRKPTNIWTNNLSWVPLPRCGYKTTSNNGAGKNCHHENVKRGTCGGISGIGRQGDHRRSIVPDKLILEVLGNTLINHK